MTPFARRLKTTIACLLLSSSLLAGEAIPDAALDKPITELKLTSGQVLKDVHLIGFASGAVMARWQDGRGTIAYQDFPAEFQQALARRRPAPKSTVKSPAVAPVVAPQQAVEKPATSVQVEATPPAAARAKIAGQCFITTQGRGAYKMSNVDVMFFPSTVVGAFQTNLVTVDLPAPLKVARTDADGNFTVELPQDSGPWVIVAQGRRYVGSVRGGDPWETYEWVVPVPNDADAVRLDNSNHRGGLHILRINASAQ